MSFLVVGDVVFDQLFFLLCSPALSPLLAVVMDYGHKDEDIPPKISRDLGKNVFWKFTAHR
jgi:hypothetical protein